MDSDPKDQKVISGLILLKDQNNSPCSWGQTGCHIAITMFRIKSAAKSLYFLHGWIGVEAEPYSI